MKCFNTLLPLAALAVLGLAAPGRGGEQVPYKGHFLPVITSATSLDATHVLFEADVTAKATIIGKAQGPAYFILDLTDLSYVGQTTWVTANGDSVYQSFEGQFVPTGTPGLFDNVEHSIVTGGTGRFAGATGESVAGGQFDFITMSAPAPIPFAGTISSPGSLKK
jgi:hypothetical protein